MSRLDPPEPGKDVIALNAAVSRIKKQVQSLEERDHETKQRTAELADQLAEIVQLLEKGTPDNTVWDWSAMDRTAAGDAWAELLAWRRDVFRARWPEFWERTTRPCWFRHPHVVEELSILYLTWRAAYRGPEASPRRAADWADRLPRAVDRIAETLKNCGTGHQELWIDGNWEHPPPLDHDDMVLSTYIEADLNSRGGLKAV